MPSGLDGNPKPVTSPQRADVLERLASAIAEKRRPGSVLRVAIDGIDGAGKTTFADELGRVLEAASVPVIRSTVDSFHNPREVRWARGKLSPEGFYLDSHNVPMLRALLLDPISASPPKPYRAAAFDEPTDAPVDDTPRNAAAGAVLLFDGLFLQRPELRRYWDFVVYLDGENRVTRQRMERATAGCPPRGDAAFLHLTWWWAVLGRYVNGFRLYVAACAPGDNADAVVDNNDFLAPDLRM